MRAAIATMATQERFGRKLDSKRLDYPSDRTNDCQRIAAGCVRTLYRKHRSKVSKTQRVAYHSNRTQSHSRASQHGAEQAVVTKNRLKYNWHPTTTKKKIQNSASHWNQRDIIKKRPEKILTNDKHGTLTESDGCDHSL